MEKRGQLFLIAAIIIVAAIVSVSSVFNAARAAPPNEGFYDLSKEIKFETKRVLDYGLYYQADTDALVKGFLEKYAAYIAQDRVVFLVGNESGLFGLFFQGNALSGSVSIVTGQTTVVPVQVIKQEQALITPDPQTGIISVTIDGVNYYFKLREGQNFFFVIGRDKESGNSYFSSG